VLKFVCGILGKCSNCAVDANGLIIGIVGAQRLNLTSVLRQISVADAALHGKAGLEIAKLEIDS